jgi:sulfide:quinone oxidoreductase
LNFGATKGLGPELNSHSVCTYGHAAKASRALDELIAQMKKGDKKTFLIGTGHGTCTCQGAAFEYAFNVDYKLRKMNVRDKAEIVWISNEYELGDFGVGGLHLRRGGYITQSKVFTESLYSERGIKWITRAHIKEVGPQEVCYETLEGEEKTVVKDFAMLLPPFAGVGLLAIDKEGNEITNQLFAPSGFMLVDADYTKKNYDEWAPSDWPKLYQNPIYKNIFAGGIAFAPPHPISKPMQSQKGTPIFPTPPRTGMPTGVMAREIAYNIADMMSGKADTPTRQASMANMGAACIASAGANFLSGTAAAITMYPIIPDYKTYPETGRSIKYTTGEIGLAGHWIKHLLHHAFIYKAKANPLWQIVPE